MESKFHRWWLGSCVAALLLASWTGGFSVAVTVVFVVIYLTGVALVGPEDEADIGLTAGDESATEPDVAELDAEPYPDDDADEADDAAAVVVEADAVDDAAAVVDTAVVETDAGSGEPERSPA